MENGFAGILEWNIRNRGIASSTYPEPLWACMYVPIKMNDDSLDFIFIHTSLLLIYLLYLNSIIGQKNMDKKQHYYRNYYCTILILKKVFT